MQGTTVASASNEVAELLKEALDRGHLIVLRTSPPHDGAKASRLVAIKQAFGLTLAQSRALMALLECKQVSRETMHAAVAPDGKPTSKPKIVDVVLGKVRAKLASHGIKIDTIYGFGFKLAAGGRDKIDRLLAEYNAEVTPTVPPPDLTPDDCAS